MSEQNMPTVLITDDDANLIQALCRQMRKEGFNLMLAVDGYQALHFAQRFQPDVLVLDINMPAGDGFAIYDRMQEVPGMEDVPVIFITGERSQRITNGIEAAKPHSVLYKPFEAGELATKIRDALLVKSKA